MNYFPPVRWYIESRVWRQWDSRMDEWVERSTESKPKLQYYEQESGMWVDVPTWIQEERP